MTESLPKGPDPAPAKANFLKRIWQSRHRISTRLTLYITGATVLTLVTSAVALFFFAYQAGKLQQVSNQDVPRLIAAFEVAQSGSKLAAALPRLQAASTTNFDQVVAEVNENADEFDRLVIELMETEQDEDNTKTLEFAGQGVKENILSMIGIVQRRFELQAQVDVIRNQQEQLQREIQGLLRPMIDDQLFFSMTGLKALDQPGTVESTTNVQEFEHYRYLREVDGAVESASELLSSVFTENDADRLIPRLEEFEANEARVQRYARLLPQVDEVQELTSLITALFALGIGEKGGFLLRGEVLDLQRSETDLINASRELIDALYGTGELLVNLSSQATNQATEEVSTANTIAIVLLILINVICIAGAVFITRTFVLKRVVNRVEVIADRMFTMADGNLNVHIPRDGLDEIADMAKALEVFRQNSLEALRLNEVESLNQQLSETNDQLEKINEDLKTAQSQIIMREKLAAMGELTAGVAHEIKNPLNFVMNFAESSSELLEELIEELALPEGERDAEITEELKTDLTSNLERIQQHGERANSIVRDMLAMGRESVDWEQTKINRLLSEHANLAFHSARAANTEFQMSIEEDLEEDLPEITAIPSDLGRVFLNMFMNSCHAIEQRRKTDSSDYKPTLSVRSKRDGEWVEVQIEDNGTGISEDKIEKIFQPFFTTKPTDEGTGLGLALAADIVRAHGGNVSVDSEVNQYTRMTMRLPIEQTAEATTATNT